MPDRIDDALAHSEHPRHQLTCPKCGDVIKGSTSLGVRMAMKFHRKVTCTKSTEKKDFMSNPYGELIAQLSQMAETLDGPFQNMSALNDSQDLAPAEAARSGLLDALGMLPLPQSHPDYASIAGAIGQAQGEVDNVTLQYQTVLQQAAAATVACQAAKDAVMAVITGFESGMG